MKDATQPDRRFLFIEALTSAAGNVCAGLESEAPGFFNYRGRSLQFAVERALYFWGLENEELFNSFAVGLGDGPERAAQVMNERVSARVLNSGPMSSRLPTWMRPAWEFLRRVKAFFRHKLGSQAGTRASFRSSRAVETLFFVHHPKFVVFLGKVLAGLGESGAICATEHLQDFEALTRFRFVGMGTPRLLWASAGRGLAGFPFLLQMFDSISDALRRERPLRAVVAEGNSPIDELVNQAAAGLGIPTVCIQQGWSPFVHPGFKNLSFDRMLVWGQGFADLLRPYSPDERFTATGNPSLPDGKISADAFARKRIVFFLQAPTRLISHSEWTAFLELAGKTAERNPDCEVVIREHPTHQLSVPERNGLGRHPNLVFAPTGLESLGALLGRSSLVVSMYSTTIMESIAAGILPIIANLTALPKYWPDVQAAGAGIEVDSVEAALAAVDRCLTEPEYYRSFAQCMRDFADYFFAARGSEAAEKTVRCIRATGVNSI